MKWDGVEKTKYWVNYLAVKGTINRRAFWLHLQTFGQPPPRDEAHLHQFLLACLARKEVPLPATVAIQRNQAEGELKGLRGVGMFVVGIDGLRVLKSYPSSRGVPHSPPAWDYYFKHSTREFASTARVIPADPASLARVCRPSGMEDLDQPTTFEPPKAAQPLQGRIAESKPRTSIAGGVPIASKPR